MMSCYPNSRHLKSAVFDFLILQKIQKSVKRNQTSSTDKFDMKKQGLSSAFTQIFKQVYINT